jgi:hypothetical protein
VLVICCNISTNLGYMWAFNNFPEKVTLELLENALLIQFAHINESPEENNRLMRAKQRRNLALIRRAFTIIPSHATAVRAKFPLVVNFSALSCDSCVRRSATNYISVFSVRAGPCARRGAPSAIHPIRLQPSQHLSFLLLRRWRRSQHTRAQC